MVNLNLIKSTTDLIIFQGNSPRNKVDKKTLDTLLNAAIIMDRLSGLSDVELSGLVSEILNYNRFKSSTLGIYIAPTASDEIQRNILP